VIRDDIMKEIPDGRLRLFVIWEPILPTDSEDAVPEASEMLKDEWRAQQFWDPAVETGQRVKKMFDLKIAKPAWDVYLLYAPGTKWHGDPPQPAYWMHQLTFVHGDADDQRYGTLKLDAQRYRNEIESRLKR
jgi:hypothetical protein